MIVSRQRRITILCVIACFAACQPADRDETAEVPEPAVVEVTARDFAFEAPAEIPSGWTTFQMTNAGAQHHFLVLWRLPEGRTLEDYESQVVSAFEAPTRAYQAGELDRSQMMQALGEALPEWFAEVQGMGGPGLTAPGAVARTTVDLVPGTYVMECYVKTPDGVFHSALGMMREITVTADSTGASPPEADIDMTLSNYEIATAGPLTAGRHTVRVRVADTPEGLLGHDVHLARLDAETPLDELAGWMDWVDALTDPPPASFLGGAEQVPAGHTTYFSVDLTPGRYAWVSEEYAPRGMIEEFTVQ